MRRYRGKGVGVVIEKNGSPAQSPAPLYLERA